MTPYEQRWLRQLEIKAAEHHVDIIRLWRRGSLMPQDYPGYPFGAELATRTGSTETWSTASTATEPPFTPATGTFSTFTLDPDCPECVGFDTLPSTFTVRATIEQSLTGYCSSCFNFIPFAPIIYDCATVDGTLILDQKNAITSSNGGGAYRFKYVLQSPLQITQWLSLERQAGEAQLFVDIQTNDIPGKPSCGITQAIFQSSKMNFVYPGGQRTFSYFGHTEGTCLSSPCSNGLENLNCLAVRVGFDGCCFATQNATVDLCSGRPLGTTGGKQWEFTQAYVSLRLVV